MGAREYEDETLGSFNLDKPDWSESTRANLEQALVETGAWEKDEAAEYSLPGRWRDLDTKRADRSGNHARTTDPHRRWGEVLPCHT